MTPAEYGRGFGPDIDPDDEHFAAPPDALTSRDIDRMSMQDRGERAARLEAECEAPKKKRKKSSTSPTQRTLKAAKERGYVVQVVERWNAHARVRVDLFGVIDLVGVRPTEDRRGLQIVGVQATSGPNHAARRTKILAEPRAKLWCDAGGVLELWSWSKRASGRWEVRVEVFTAESWRARDAG